ncbi:MAG: Ig-like domain-containing protein, partial [Nanoarchaeota archaeon]|nr:Ig-like domain-containing protein [Nanoarchaeota archaeon]
MNIIVDKITAFVGEVINIRATLTDEKLTPLPDKKVDFYADAQIIGSNVTDSEGTAKVSWNTSSWLPGAYTVTADYAGDEIYSPNSGNGMVTINSGLDNVSSNITTEALPIIPNNATLAKVFNEDALEFDRSY